MTVQTPVEVVEEAKVRLATKGVTHTDETGIETLSNDSTPGEPQLEIILQGLPLDCLESDVSVLAAAKSEDIQGMIPYEASSTKSMEKIAGLKRSGWPETDTPAQDFMEQFAPSIRIGQNWVRVAYSKNPSGSRDRHRRCPECGMIAGHSESCHQLLMNYGKTQPTDELDVKYAAIGDTFKSGPPPAATGRTFSILETAAPKPSLVIQELPALPTAPKMNEAQLAGIAAAKAAEQLAKAEEKKRKVGQSTIGIGGGGKKVSIQLQRWSSKQVELQSKEVQPQPQSTSAQDIPDETLIGIGQAVSQEPPNLSYEPDELLDFKLVACLLCQRRLKSVQDLRKHQSLSDLHKKNLLDPLAIQAALKKARGGVSTGVGAIATVPTGAGLSSATLAKNPSASSLADSDFSSTLSSLSPSMGMSPLKLDEVEPKYRDRAAERRQIFGQPDYPLPPLPSGREYSGRGGGRHGGNGGDYRGGGGNSDYGGHGHEIIIPEQPTKDGIKDDNIGNRLLKSMGWKEGQGLGKDGDGIKAPIEASGYSKGVGIGAGLVRKADSANSMRGSLGNYAESAKELARRRYEQSG
ncbi:RNA-binding protein 5 [Mortierella claussenii]|nr:RNA-binding protein 5 [Mortierella claussenii]